MQITRIWALGVLLGTSGCQCCALTERYQDHIDHIADRQPHGERFYHPGLDLTRIGYPDWCQNPVNRWIFGDCCCRDTRQQPGYVHNPMYFPSPRDREIEPIPTEAPIAPRDDVGPEMKGTEEVPTKIKGIPDPRQLEMGDKLPPLPPVPGPDVIPEAK